jgi:hypothetical protein
MSKLIGPLARCGFSLVLLSLSPSVPAQLSGQDELVIDEVESWVFPASAMISGVNEGNRGELLAWSFERGTLWSLTDSGAALLWADSTRQPIGVFSPRGARFIELLDAARREVLQLTRLGEGGVFLTGKQGIAIEFSLDSAARGQVGWYIGGRDDRGGFHLVLFGSEGTIREVLSPKSLPSPLLGIASAHLTPVQDGVLMSELRSPFRTLLLTPHGQIKGHLDPSPMVSSLSAIHPDEWIAMPALPVDAGSVQSFSHLKTDSRVLVRFDRNGKGKGERHLSIPLTLFSVLPTEKLILGARSVGDLEIVAYRWRWRARKGGIDE